MNLEGAQWLSGRVLDSLNPDQDQHSELGPYCLQRLPADNKSCCKTMKLKLFNDFFLSIERHGSKGAWPAFLMYL